MARSSIPPRPDGLLDRRLLYVSGKGGVGKSTVAGALGLAALRRGLRTVVAEVHRRSDVEHAVTSRGVDHISIDPQEAMEEYLADQLPVRALADLLVSSRAFAYLAAATPGMRELLTAGKVWELAQDERRTPGARPYDVVVVDAPATGHGVAVLAAPRTFADAARVGPIARQGGIIDATFSDPAQTAVVAVTTPEELPVNETLALRDAVRGQLGGDLALVVVNGLRPDRFTGAEADALRADGSPASRVALGAHERARAQRAQLARLRRGLGREVPVIRVPFIPTGADLDLIADRLERAL
jgi:anion-transporting  ArsA/GET3 family ATPase